MNMFIYMTLRSHPLKMFDLIYFVVIVVVCTDNVYGESRSHLWLREHIHSDAGQQPTPAPGDGLQDG